MATPEGVCVLCTVYWQNIVKNGHNKPTETCETAKRLCSQPSFTCISRPVAVISSLDLNNSRNTAQLAVVNIYKGAECENVFVSMAVTT